MAFSKIGGKGIDLSTDVITEFNSTGVDDNATATTITLNANNTATIPNVTGNTTFNEYITVTNLTVNNDALISNDLTVGGNFIITGNTFTVDSTSLKVEDSLIHLAGNNVSNDIIDIGFIGHYSNDSGNTELFTGFYRDATDEQYYLFNGLSDDINTATTIDKTGTGFTYATLNVGEFHSNYNSGDGVSVAGGSVTITRQSGFPNLFWDDGTDNLGAIYYDKTNGMRIFSTDGSTGNPERVRIDTSGSLRVMNGVDTSMTSGANGQFMVDGNAYTGAITLDGTAMYLYHNSASRALVLATNETAQLTLLASGDVQVNRGKLYVHDSAGSTTNSLKLSYNATNGGAVFGPDSNGGSTYLSIGTSNAGTFAERIYVSSAGNVGVGDGNPQEKLSVLGGILAASSSGSTSGITIESTATSGYVSTITHTDTGVEFDTGSILRNFEFDAAGTNLWTLYTNTGNVQQNYGVYRFAATTSGSDTGSQFQLWGTNGGPGYLAAYQLNFNTGSNNSRTTAMQIDNNGNVGIDATPANKLQIGSMGSTGYSGNYLAVGDGTRVFSIYPESSGDAIDFYTNRLFRFKASGSGATGDVRIENFLQVGLYPGVQLGQVSIAHGSNDPEGQTTNTKRDLVTLQNTGVMGFRAFQDGFNNAYDGALAIFSQSYSGSAYVWAERMRISSHGYVGINYKSPQDQYAKNLVVGAGSEGGITIRSTNTSYANYLMFSDGAAGGNERYRGYIGYQHSLDSMNFISHGIQRWYVGSTTPETMRLTSDRHLLIGDSSTMAASSSSNLGSITSGATFGSIMAGSGGGGGTVGSNLTLNSSNTPRIAFTHTGGYGAAGVYFSWGSTYFYNTNGNVTAGGAPDLSMDIRLGGGNSTITNEIRHYDRSGNTTKRDRIYRFITFSTGGYVHMKTNISWASHTQMYSIHFEGQEYQASRAIDTTLSWYSYSPNNAAINVGSYGTHTASVYSSSDGYLVMVLYANSTTYYSAFTVSLRTTAQGINASFAITASTQTTSSTGAY